MPAARELLLDAAFTALGTRPWHGVRMVDVAAAAGVSRQTLYNEFGSKDGLARALVRREAETFLAGVEHSLATARDATGPDTTGPDTTGPDTTGPDTTGPDTAGRDPVNAGDRCAAAALWTLRTARANPFVRAALTGCRGDRLPPAAAPSVPAPRAGREARPPRGALSPGALVGRIRDSVAGAVGADAPGLPPDAVLRACEAAVRLTLSYVVAPAPSDEEVAAEVAGLVRALLAQE
ncbi:TetR/AcrR family transcriptional regulator [Streptomyces luteoverticillatus]|uniref:TetR/AcrR family transcriptional regulator n=1 Tax=Streptomyces luteoverticillatus TaxID=66425 RepID=A0A3S9PMB2_STRLT|nr:TetR family transcriptional regulator [Streptomyces luteoverticillatus]AZQ73434.1 TetR/AcrR family transcriptional regulator [Streptomyces luteoverticillatus]